jgi:hypothetical protein
MIRRRATQQRFSAFGKGLSRPEQPLLDRVLIQSGYLGQIGDRMAFEIP